MFGLILLSPTVNITIAEVNAINQTMGAIQDRLEDSKNPHMAKLSAIHVNREHKVNQAKTTYFNSARITLFSLSLGELIHYSSKIRS